MDTVDWNADICSAPVWRYIYHTLHSADKFFINPSSWAQEDEPPFHSHMLDWPDTQADTVLSKETLYAYFDKVWQKITSYIDSLNDVQLTERPNGKLTRLGLILSQFRHMYAHIGILNGVTIANTQQYPRVINEGAWCSGKLPEGLYDVEERKWYSITIGDVSIDCTDPTQTQDFYAKGTNGIKRLWALIFVLLFAVLNTWYTKQLVLHCKKAALKNKMKYSNHGYLILVKKVRIQNAQIDFALNIPPIS